MLSIAKESRSSLFVQIFFQIPARELEIHTYMQETREPIKKIVVQFRLSPLSIISSERGDLTGRGGSYPRLDGCSLTRGCT